MLDDDGVRSAGEDPRDEAGASMDRECDRAADKGEGERAAETETKDEEADDPETGVGRPEEADTETASGARKRELWPFR